MANTANDYISRLEKAIAQRVLLLDGSMGVMIQRLALSEAQFRGSRLANHHVALQGNNDILCLTAPDVVASIHHQYLEAGADIIETNTFNSTVISQREYDTSSLVTEINLAGARIARAEADRFSTPDRPRFVAGSMGPTGVAASLSADINDVASRSVTFDELRDAYRQQAGALIDGGVDLLLIETIFDLLNAKAAVAGARLAMEERAVELPVVLSMTVSDTSGRLLSGHTPEAFVATMAPLKPFAIGFNCSAGPAGLAPFVRRLASIAPCHTIFYPNAGLPDSLGHYHETPQLFTEAIVPLLREGVVDIAGGCCGTLPVHTAMLAGAIKATQSAGNRPSRHTVAPDWLAGLEAFADDRGFINIGERCNVAGSRKFLRLIKEKAYDEAVAIARKQVDDGAMILDINMDDGLLDTPGEMEHFLRMLSCDPKVASVPWMIDSSDFDVICRALKNVVGRPIVNSISLKHGEEEFVNHAREIRRYGAAVVVMAFDEQGQATTFERKIEICERAYRLLTQRAGFDPRDIIFDPNVLTIATGMADHDRYALDFIRAVEWISQNLPGAKTSGGLSNLSFAFRGNNYLRQAMHAVFLYHAIRAGLSMAIMDPGAKVTYDSIPAELLTLLEDAILCRRDDAAERLIESAPLFAGGEISGGTAEEDLSSLPVDKRLAKALVAGDDSRLEADIAEAVEVYGSANAVVEEPLMAGMEQVGTLFEEGKMFLPQVVKSARTMHRAVEILRPLLEQGRKVAKSKGVFLLATVKGDVHDIGKNIAAVVLQCNNFEVIDLGVQVEAHAIVEAARHYKPQFIGLSGLISPSLAEMARVAAALHEAAISVPLFVGGAATSQLHTALHIAPAYGDGVVVRVADASQNPVVASRLMADFEGECKRIKESQAALVEAHNAASSPAGVSTSAKDLSDTSERPDVDWTTVDFTTPTFTGGRTIDDVAVEEVIPFINWRYFYNCWKVTPATPEADALYSDALRLLDEMKGEGAVMRCRVAFYEAYSVDNEINIGGTLLPVERQSPTANRRVCLSLTDFVAPEGYGDHVGCFAVTIGERLRRMEKEAEGDTYRHLLVKSLCDRLAEATSEWLHYKVRTSLWGYAPDEPLDTAAICRGNYRGIRPAVGYPSLPDQSLMHTLAQLVDPAAIGIEVTPNGALYPSSSVAGFYIASPHSRYFSL